MRPLASASLFLVVASSFASSAARAQSPPSGPTISALLSSGYDLKAASSNGLTQYLYFEGADAAGRKKIYACQLQFGSSGGFQGCLALP